MSSPLRPYLASLALLGLALGLGACPAKFHPADRVDADGDGFFAPGPGELDGFFVCRLVYRDGVDVLVQAGDTSQVVEDVATCLTVSELEERQIDCDDSEDDRFPGAAELCDGVDNDCDSALDEAEDDADGDLYTECGFDPNTREVTLDRDCNDDTLLFGFYQNPGRTEVCGMAPNSYLLGAQNLSRPQVGLDDNCDGLLYLDPENPEMTEVDGDADGHARCPLVDLANPEADTIAVDCDDTNPDVNPSIGVDGTAGAGVTISCVEGLDFDSACVPADESTNIEKILWAPDSDLDGDGELLDDDEDGIADDLNGDDIPDNYLALCAGETPELGNWIDLSQPNSSATDCDDEDPRLEGLDFDEDGFSTCDGDYFPGFISADAGGPGSDDAACHPNAVEICDALDNNLDGAVDQNLTGGPSENFDLDGDGAFAGQGCASAYDADELDCDDDDPLQNQLDLDLDGDTTCGGDCNDADPEFSLQDADGDGYSTCGALADCDDDDPLKYPFDVDGDGVEACDDDCLDTIVDDPSTPSINEALLSPNVFPGASAQCDGWLDTDCDGVEDALEGDADLDGASPCDGDCDDSNSDLNIDDVDGDSYTTCDGDCLDTEPAMFPGAPLLCDGLPDNDCNLSDDPNEADLDQDGESICDGDCDDSDDTLTSADGDNDGYSTCDGDCNDSVSSLNLDDVDGDGWPSCDVGVIPGDCDDNDPFYNPGDNDGDGVSTCGPDGQEGTPDDDCDDLDAILNTNDEDGDGVSSCDGDCDDQESSVQPSGNEGSSPDGLDNDCDGEADEGLLSGGEIAVTEIMVGASPATTDGFGEYIEVINDASHPVDLRGWSVEVTNDATFGTTTFTFDSTVGFENALVVAPGQRAVLARSSNIDGYGIDIADIYWEAAGLSDVGGSIELIFGTSIDLVSWNGSGCVANCDPLSTNPSYSGPSYWRTGHAIGLKEAHVTANPSSSNNSDSNWCEEADPLGSNEDFGSPGTAPAGPTGPCG